MLCHVLLFEGRSGAGYESTGSDPTGDGKENYLVAGGRDHWHDPLSAGSMS